ncbi:hypothetical protein CEXT_265301, partial [Caerostris extrusa]
MTAPVARIIMFDIIISSRKPHGPHTVKGSPHKVSSLTGNVCEDADK